MSTYKLYYFQIRGSAESIRLIFALKGIEYEDVRIAQEDWPNKKEDMPLKAMPVLEIDGKKYCQSAALVRFLARKYDLYGKDPLESLVIDEVHESLIEMSNGVSAIFGASDDKKKQELMKEMETQKFPKFVKFIENKVKATKGKFLLGDEISVGDIVIYRSMGFLKDFAASFGTPNYDWTWGSTVLSELYNNVEKEPKIAAWIAKRPQNHM